ncbi:MAG: hypothetical protein MJ221_03550, partial [Bacilli bacterium]|nr:hypothetical protein [Bacilli bacterium]
KYFEDKAGTKPISDIEAWKNGDGKLEATGHEFNEPIYKWSDDNSSCTASRTCKHEGCIEIETETVKAVEKDGKIVATFTNPAFAEQFKDKPANTGLIVGLSVGGGVLLVGVGAGLFFFIRKKRHI